MADFRVAPGIRQFEVNKIIIKLKDTKYINHIIVSKANIIVDDKDGKIPFYKPVNSWKKGSSI